VYWVGVKLLVENNINRKKINKLLIFCYIILNIVFYLNFIFQIIVHFKMCIELVLKTNYINLKIILAKFIKTNLKI